MFTADAWDHFQKVRKQVFPLIQYFVCLKFTFGLSNKTRDRCSYMRMFPPPPFWDLTHFLKREHVSLKCMRKSRDPTMIVVNITILFTSYIFAAELSFEFLFSFAICLSHCYDTIANLYRIYNLLRNLNRVYIQILQNIN